MFHVDNNSAVPVMPAVKPVVSAVTSFFTEGGNGVPPTYPGPDWFNIIQSELLAVLAAAGITPDKANNVQLLAAMRALFLDTSQNGADIQDKALFLQNLGLKDFANKAATTKQTFADALACKYGVEVNDDQGTTRAGLYTSNGQSKITGYSNKAIIIPDKVGTMALAGESVTALRLSSPREVTVTAANAWVNFETSEIVVGLYIAPTAGGGAWVLNKVKVSTLQANINGAWVNVTQ